MSYVIAGDLGVTKTHLAIFQVKETKITPVLEKKYDSKGFKTFEDMLKVFLSFNNKKITSAAFSVAGFCSNGKCKIQQLNWVLDSKKIAELLGVQRAVLVNDFEAVGYGIDLLTPKDMIRINNARQAKNATRAVIGAGTGLGEAILFWNGTNYTVVPSEGMNGDFSPRTDLEWKLKKSLMQKVKGSVHFGNVLSEQGLVNIYEFLKTEKEAKETDKVKTELKKKDRSEVILSYGLSEKDSLCTKSIEIFTSLYGSESGNLALKAKAMGGIYLAGAIAPKMIKKLKTKTFISSFHNKDRMQHLLKKMPVFVVKNEKVGLIGAANIARMH